MKLITQLIAILIVTEIVVSDLSENVLRNARKNVSNLKLYGLVFICKTSAYKIVEIFVENLPKHDKGKGKRFYCIHRIILILKTCDDTQGASERDLCDFVRDFWSVPRFSVTLYMTV